MRRTKKFALAMMLFCILGLTGCSSTTEHLFNASIPVSAEILSIVSIANGTAIKNANKTDNQLYVVYDNGDILTYVISATVHPVSVSLDLDYISSEKKSVDFVFNLIKKIIGEGYEDQLPDTMKDELNFAIENDSSVEWEFQIADQIANVRFQQTGSIFNFYIGY